MTASLLFDLDGTIVETDHLHFEAFKTIFTPHGVALDWEGYKAGVMGRNNVAIAADFLPHVPQGERAAIMDRKEATYRGMLEDMEAASGLLALLDWADAHHIPCGVVTNAPRPNADALLAMLGIRHRFKVVVIGPELRETKPHPLPYLTALEILGGVAASSVAFEDSRAGVASGVAAKLGVAGLTTSFDAATLLSAGAEITGADFNDEALLSYVRRRTGL